MYRASESAAVSAVLRPPRERQFCGSHLSRAFLWLWLAAGAFIAWTSGPGVRPAVAQSASDSAAIHRAALDYIEGWYEGDAERMRRALHPQLVKRIVQGGRSQPARLGEMGADALIGMTGRGPGRRTPKERQQKEVSIYAIDGEIASVKVVSAEFVDHMHLARWNGEWRIVNVLWKMRSAGPS